MNTKVYRTGLGMTVAASIIMAGCATEHYAKPEAAGQSAELDRIEVTGSRIKRADIESASPVFVIQRERAPGNETTGVSSPDEFTTPKNLATGKVLEDYRGLFRHKASRQMIGGVSDMPVIDEEPIVGMQFQHYGVNPSIDTRVEPVSTFSIDVDRGSYTMARNYLSRDVLPPPESVRVEEFVNAFEYNYPAPQRGTFAVSAEAFPSPTRPGYHMLLLGLKGKEVSAAQRKPANLVFVIDVSGSMSAENRLEQVKESLSMLAYQMNARDTISIVTYGTNARVELPPTSANQQDKILAVIDGLGTNGSTNAAAGVMLGYEQAKLKFAKHKINRIILCSDGVANVGPATNAEQIRKLIGDEAAKGIHLTTIGFGMGNYNDVLMEQMAQLGGGNYYYVDRPEEADRVFVENMTGTLQTIAEDVKIQVEFDPNAVSEYRLLGYENRHLENADFANDRKDAGEIGSGHAVTAIYEIKLADSWQSMGTFRLRYKEPGQARSKLVEHRLNADIIRPDFQFAMSSTKLAVAAAVLAEKLRGSYWARNLSYADVEDILRIMPDSIRTQSGFGEFDQMLASAKRLDKREFDWPATEYASNDEIPVLQ